MREIASALTAWAEVRFWVWGSCSLCSLEEIKPNGCYIEYPFGLLLQCNFLASPCLFDGSGLIDLGLNFEVLAK